MPTVHYANHNFLKQNNLRIGWSIDENALDRSASFVDENRVSVNDKGKCKAKKPTAKDSIRIQCSGVDSQKQLESSSSHGNGNRNYPGSASNLKRKEIVKGGSQQQHEQKRQRSGHLSTHDQSKAYSDSNTSQKMTEDKKQKSWPLRDIDEPGINDCLVGRGGGTNHHPGNKHYRQMIADNRATYKGRPRSDKGTLAMKIVQDWRSQDPPGRFLKINDETHLWDDVGDEIARVKVSQSLREKSTEKTGSKKREEDVSYQR